MEAKIDLKSSNSFQTDALCKTTTTYALKAIQQPGYVANGEAEVVVIQP